MTLCAPSNVQITTCAKADIAWWANFMCAFNGVAYFIHKEAMPSSAYTTDACVNGGGSAFYDDWFYVNWDMDLPAIAPLHINLKELFTVCLSAVRWAPQWSRQHVIVYTDNMATMCMINKGSSRNVVAMSWLRGLFWLSACHNFHLTARYIPGKLNMLSDTISRLDEFPISVWINTLQKQNLNMSDIYSHVSHNTFSALQDRERLNGNL